MKFKVLFYGIVALFFFNNSNSLAQNVYEDGKIFLKTKENLQAGLLPQFESVSGRNTLIAFPELSRIATDFGLERMVLPFKTRSEALDRTYEVHFDKSNDIEKLISELNRLPYVEYAEKVPVYSMSLIPNDYNASQLYHLDVIRATNAWDITTGSSQVVIGIVDNAVLTTHIDLINNIWINPNEIPGNGIDDDNNGYIDDINGWDAANWDNDPNPPNGNFSHGTHVAGCAAATTNNGTGVASIGYNCSIMAVKAKSDNSSGPSLDATLPGLDYAVAAGADVINMSFGGSGFSQTWQSLINQAHNQGIIVVAAAGNDGTNATFYPASYNHVINVGSTNSSDNKSGFSNYGPTVDVMAPGSWIRSTVPSFSLTSSYANFSGTSMASPIAAGLLGLMKSVEPMLTPNSAEACLKSTCENIDNVGSNSPYAGLMGAGRIDAFMAVNCLVNPVMPVAAFSVEATKACGGEFKFLDNSQNIPINWQWDFGNGMTSNAQNPQITLPATGNYNITLIVNNAAGSDTITQNVNVTVLDQPVADAGADISVCYGEQAQLNGSSNIPVDYQWSPSTGLSGTSVPDPIITVTMSREYYLTIHSADGCTDIDTVGVEVLPNPTTWAGSDKTINPGDSAQMNALGALTYEWSPVTGLSDPNIANPKASPAVSTLYTVSGYNQEGCLRTDEVWVNVTGTTSIDDNSFGNLGMIHRPYPQPAGESITFSADFNQPGALSISLLDMSGRQIVQFHEKQVAAGPFEMHWKRSPSVSAGLYMAVWKMGDARTVQKIQLY